MLELNLWVYDIMLELNVCILVIFNNYMIMFYKILIRLSVFY